MDVSSRLTPITALVKLYWWHRKISFGKYQLVWSVIIRIVLIPRDDVVGLFAKGIDGDLICIYLNYRGILQEKEINLFMEKIALNALDHR